MNIKKSRLNRFLAVAVCAFTLACNSSSVVLDGDITLLVQIVGSPHPDVTQLNLTFGAVSLTPDGEAPQPLAATNAQGNLHDVVIDRVLRLQIASGNVRSVNYTHLTLAITSASISLVSGLTFADGTTAKAIALPQQVIDGATIDLNFSDANSLPGVNLGPGVNRLLVHLDGPRSLILTRSPTDANVIESIAFSPNLHAVFQVVAAGVTGIVEDETGAIFPNVLVSAKNLAPTIGPFQDSVVTTLTRPDGTFFIPWIQPGDYEVSVQPIPAGTAPPQALILRAGAISTELVFRIVP